MPIVVLGVGKFAAAINTLILRSNDYWCQVKVTEMIRNRYKQGQLNIPSRKPNGKATRAESNSIQLKISLADCRKDSYFPIIAYLQRLSITNNKTNRKNALEWSAKHFYRGWGWVVLNRFYKVIILAFDSVVVLIQSTWRHFHTYINQTRYIPQPFDSIQGHVQ